MDIIKFVTQIAGGGFHYGRTIVLFGDSITQACGVHPTNRGYFDWLNFKLKQAFDVTYNAGVAGNSSAQMLARIQADVIAKRPNWCLVMGGSNDIAADVAAATTVANLQIIYNTLHGAKINVIASTLSPSTSFNSEARGTAWTTINQAIRDFATANPWLILADAGPEYLDTTQPTLAVPLANYTADGVHPTGLGAASLGLKMYTDINANSLIQKLAPYTGLVTANIDAGRIYYANANQLMTGDATDHITAPAEGVHASNWFISAGGVWSKVARADGLPGVWQQCVIGAEADAALIGLPDRTANWVVGESWYAQCEFESDDDWVSPVCAFLYLSALDGANTVLAQTQSLGYSIVGGSGSAILNPRFGTFRTANMVIPANTTKLRPYFTVQATSGTFRISRLEFLKAG